MEALILYQKLQRELKINYHSYYESVLIILRLFLERRLL